LREQQNFCSDCKRSHVRTSVCSLLVIVVVLLVVTYGYLCFSRTNMTSTVSCIWAWNIGNGSFVIYACPHLHKPLPTTPSPPECHNSPAQASVFWSNFQVPSEHLARLAPDAVHWASVAITQRIELHRIENRPN
jgi:hypothetical protein